MSIFRAQPAPIKNYSGSQKVFYNKSVKILKRHQYTVSPERLSGDAPKDFIKVYEYGRCRKANQKKWIPYISKIGHKWFPVESITEHLLTRLGQEWGFNMADSKLFVVATQVRFCSEYFLKPDQELVHGADILSRYLQEDNAELIEQIDRNGWSQELLPLQFVKNAIKSVFPDQAHDINCSLVNLLLFDAIVGNNDRHFFNWGVLRNVRNKHSPIFSPIYDTARGLFWNTAEEKLISLHRDERQLKNFIVKYHNNTKPKVGWENQKEINHCEMVECLLVSNECSFDFAHQLFSNVNLVKAENLLNSEFNDLISDVRKKTILRYLEYRFGEFVKLLN